MSELIDVTALPSTPIGLLPRGVRRDRKPHADLLGSPLAGPSHEGNVLAFATPGGIATINQSAGDVVIPVSLEMWIKTSITAAQTILVTQPSGARFTLPGTLAVNIVGDRVSLVCTLASGQALTVQSTDTRPVTDGSWHHLAVTCTPSSTTIYKDGVATGESLRGLLIYSTGSSISVGGGSAGMKPFLGQVFDVRLWSAALTATQIQTRRYLTLTGSEDDLLVALSLNRTTQQTVNLVERSTGSLTGCSAQWQPLPSPASVALSLSGGGDYVDIGAVTGVTSDAATLECWLQLSTDPGVASTPQTVLLCQSDGTDPAPRFSYQGGDRLGFFWHNSVGGADEGGQSGDTSIISDGQWHHLAIVFDRGTVTYYKDGLPLADTHQFAAALPSNSLLQVGPGVGSTSSLNGLVTDVRMWNEARTAAEISSFRFVQLTGTEPGLVALCNLSTADPANPATMKPFDQVGSTAGQLHGKAAVVVAPGPVQPLPTAVWSYPLTGVSPLGPPLAANGILCVENGTNAQLNSLLHSVDLETARTRWTYNPNTHLVGSTGQAPPVLRVAGGTAYLGVETAPINGGQIALHAVDTAAGTAVWAPVRIQAKNFMTRPVVSGDRVVFGVNATPEPTSTAAALAVVDATAGTAYIGATLVPKEAVFMSDPLFAGTIAYTAAAFSSGAEVFAVDVGQLIPVLLWSVLPATVTGNLAAGPSSILVPAGGTLLCLDEATGHQLWAHALSGSPVTNAPILIGSTVYVGSTDGVLYALDAATGTEQWRVDTHWPIITELVNEDGVLYFANQGDGVDVPPAFVALDTNSRGADVLTYAVPQADTISFAQGAANGVVYFYGTQTVYAVNMTATVREFEITTKLIVEDYDTSGTGGPTGSDTSYRVGIVIRDDYGMPRINQAVKVWSAQPVHVVNQGAPLTLGPDDQLWMETDTTGTLTLAISAFDDGTPQGTPNVTCPPLYLWASFMPAEAAVTIYPDGEQLTTLAGVQGPTPTRATRRKVGSGAPSMYLDQATGYDGTPLISAEYGDPGSLSAIASCIRNTIGSPSASPAGVTRLADPHRSRRYLYRTTTAHALYAPTASVSPSRGYVAGAIATFTVDFGADLAAPTFTPNTYDPTLPAGLARHPGPGVGGVFSDIEHFTSNVVKGAETVAKMAWQAVDNVVTTVIHTLENTYNLVIKTVEDAVTAVVGFLKTVVSDIRKVVQWLSTLFDWKNILRNHTIIKNKLYNPTDPANPGMLDRLSGWLTGQGGNGNATTDVGTVHQLLSGKGAASAGSTATNLHGQTVQSQQSGNSSINSSYNHGGNNNSTQCTWMQQKFNENKGAATVTLSSVGAVDPAVVTQAFSTFLKSVEAQLAGTFGQFPAQIEAALGTLRSSFSSPKSIISTGLGAVVSVLGALADDFIAFGAALAEDFIALLTALLEQLIAMITDPIEIPFLSKLYQSLTGNPLSILDLCCLIGAVPATILLAVITGSPVIPTTTAVGSSATAEQAGRIVLGAAGMVLNDLTVIIDTAGLDLALSGDIPRFASWLSRVDVGLEFVNWAMGMVVSFGWFSWEPKDWVFWSTQGIPVAVNFGYLFLSATGEDQAVRDSRLAAALMGMSGVYAALYPASYRDAPKAAGLVVAANIFGNLTGLVEFLVNELEPEETAAVELAKLIFGVVNADLNFTANVLGVLA